MVAAFFCRAQYISVNGRIVTVGGAMLQVNVPIPLIITVQPLPQSIAAGNTVTFSVSATGKAVLTYQWKVNGVNIFGATASGYSKTTSYDDDGDIYSVTITDGYGYSRLSNAVLLSITAPVVSTANFTYNLAVPATTSAGLYHGDTLVTTLWSVKKDSAGSHGTYLTGYGDNAEVIPDGNYTAKVLSHNVSYSPYGSWMNNSDSFHGNSVWRGELLTSMSFVGNFGYVNTGYDEAQFSRYKFDTSHIHQKFIISTKQTGTYGAFSCTDGHYVYWQEQASYNNATGRIMNFTYATDPSTDAEVTFSSGATYSDGANSHTSIIDSLGDVSNNTPRQANGLTVQKNGNYLFVSRPIGINVINKSTGAFVRTINITDAGFIAVNQFNDNELWMYENGVVKKYPINSDGSLGASSITVNLPTATVTPALTSGTAFDISPDGATIAIINLGRQQVHGFSTTDGSIKWTLGRLNGYYGNVLVSDTAFMFSSDFAYYPNFITYAPNGTLWIADNGNNRYQHFSTTRQFLDNICFLDRTYEAYIDGNDQTALYAKSCMVRVDPSVFPAQKGWKLMKNYKARMPALANSNGLLDTDTWPNGRTYSMMAAPNSTRMMVELQDTGLRYIGTVNYGQSGTWQFDKNGNIRQYTAHYGNSGIDYWYWAVNNLTGFDGNNNPLYANGFVTLAKMPADNSNQPVGGDQRQVMPNGNILVYNADGHTGGYHMGMVKPNSVNHFLWQNLNSTFGGFNGEFPMDYFDIGNSVSDYAGGIAMIANNGMIYENYHGENWKSAQTAMVNSYYNNGLQIGQFGTTDERAANEDAATYLTGNAQKIIEVDKSDSEQLIIQTDESKSGSLLVVKASNLKSIHIDSFQVVKNGITPVPSNITNLNAGLPINSTVSTSTLGGWVFNKVPDNNNLTIRTNVLAADRLFPDLYIHVENEEDTAYYNLPYVNGNNWEMSGPFRFPDDAIGQGGAFYFDIKDVAGKSIVHITQDYVNSSFVIHVNGVAIYTDSDPFNTATRIYNTLNFMDIKRIGANITFTLFGNTVTTPAYDNTANMGQPKTLNLDMTGGFRAGVIIDLSKFTFNNAL